MADLEKYRSRSPSPSRDELPSETPSITRIIHEAGLYEKVLSCVGCERHSRTSSEDENPNKAFVDLVGRDLDPSAQAITSGLAKLSAAGDTWTKHDLTTEPEEYDADTTSSPSTLSDASFDELDDEHSEEIEKPVVLADTDFTPRPGFRVPQLESETWKMSPDDALKLLIHEFGPLAADGDEERLLFEADGAFLSDVIILGVIHLTTHRIAFHASLLSTRPSQQIIKSGPVVIRRKGFHKKRRVWLELTHDMIASYASSRDTDHIRPIRTIMLSSVKKVLPRDAKHPRRIVLVFDTVEMVKESVVEFDTEESTAHWRRELESTIYIYRHTRRQALDSNADTSNGVRLNIPLANIAKIEPVHRFSTASLASVISISIAEHDCQRSKHEECNQHEKLQLCTIRPGPEWKKLDDYINAAKERPRRSDLPGSGTVVDFGPLSFWENKNNSPGDALDEEEVAVRRHLGLQAEHDIWISRARMRRYIASAGYFVLTEQFLGFWSKYFTQADLRYRVPLSTVKSAAPFTHKLVRIAGMRIEIEAQDDLDLQFKSVELRDEAVRRVNAAIKAANSARPTLSSSASCPPLPESPTLGPTGLPIPKRSATGIFSPLARTMEKVRSTHIDIPYEIRLQFPMPINIPSRSLYKPKRPLHFVCLTIGSRGDAQPYIALGLGLMKDGHRVTIVTHEEYKAWIESFGIEHRTAGGDPGALMKLSVENKMFSPDFFRESLGNFRGWLDDLLVEAWGQCQDADVLLESPSAMAGVHIAEALNIPYFRCFTMPWTKTTEFPHAFLSVPVDSPTFNSASYVLFDNVMWAATSGQINKWRRNTLKIGNTDMGHLAQSKITFIYNFSPAVVHKPLDWGDTTIISGYWFLDNPDPDWTAPASLLEFIATAKKDGKPIVYIGFGSITVPHPNTVTNSIIKAVLKSDVRAIISKGWSARMSKEVEPDVEWPAECYQLDKVPHDWLFPQIDAAMHHGGAGTTGASLRAGIPTIIKPWFGDQYFWATRVQKLGAGLRVASLRVNDISDALTKATTNRLMKEKAAMIGERIRSEDGVHTAIIALYTWLHRAGENRQNLDRPVKATSM